MKKIFTCLLALLGLNTACSQQHFDNADAGKFASLIAEPDVIVLDVRTPDEYADGHIADAINLDVEDDAFVDKAKALLPASKTIAVYCRSGRRSAVAAEQLAAQGFKVVNLKGGIVGWQERDMPVVTDAYETDVFFTPGGKTVRFYALVHASMRIVFDGRQILVDPVGKMGNRIIDYASMPKADYIFVTHEHGDHLDKGAIGTLSDDHTRLVTNQRCADILGFGEPLANGDVRQLADDITVEAVPAYNITEGHLQFHPQGRDNGYILTLDGLRVYIAGDTEDIPEMADVNDIDVAFMPCNQPYTMTPKQLVRAARTVRPKVLFPYHYGQTDVSVIPSQLAADGIDVRIRHYE